MKLASLVRLPAVTDPGERKTFAEQFNAALDRLGIGRGDPFLIAHPDALDGKVPTPGRCSFCDERINVNVDYRKVEGWERRRSEGGTNALALREPHEDEWACTSCIDRQKRGIAPAQGSLVT